MNKPIRIYGRLRKIGDDYYEAEYKDYRPDGTVLWFRGFFRRTARSSDQEV